MILASLFSFTLGETEESAIACLKLEGVKYCHLYVLKEHVEPARPTWLDRLIEKKIAA